MGHGCSTSWPPKKVLKPHRPCRRFASLVDRLSAGITWLALKVCLWPEADIPPDGLRQVSAMTASSDGHVLPETRP